MPRNKVGSGHLCRPVEEWSEADQAAWRKAVGQAGPFGPSTFASRWSERSRIKTARGYGRVTSVKVVEKRVSEEVAKGQAAMGGSFAGSASISGGVISAIPSICM